MEMESVLQAMHSWCQKPPGKYVYESEQLLLEKVLPELFGYYLVQIGGVEFQYNTTSAIRNHIYIAPTEVAKKFDASLVINNLVELPLCYESVDAIVLPHVLEFIAIPKKLLSEISHILIPGGTLILFGFNPYSYLGLNQIFSFRKNFPFEGTFYSIRRVKSWLRLLGLQVMSYKTFLISTNQISDVKKPFGSVYIIIAKKEQVVYTPYKLKVKPKNIPVATGYPEAGRYFYDDVVKK